jgi:hypothetical protein
VDIPIISGGHHKFFKNKIKKLAGFTKSVKLTNPHPWGL